MIESILNFLTEVLKFLGSVFRARKAGDEIVRTATIYDEMKEIVHNPVFDVHRFIIIMAHNGGSSFKSYSPAFFSVIQEEVRAPLMPMRADFQKIAIDAEYIKLLKQVYVEKEVHIETTRTPPDSLIRTVYESQGIKYARAYFLKHNRKGFWFATVGTITPNEYLDNPVTKMSIKLAVNKIRNILNE